VPQAIGAVGKLIVLKRVAAAWSPRFPILLLIACPKNARHDPWADFMYQAGIARKIGGLCRQFATVGAVHLVDIIEIRVLRKNERREQ